jgi:hypothetical protein
LFSPQVDDIERENATGIFQKDGTPPHFSLQVHFALNAKFPNWWIGRSGSIAWLPRSPDLTPLDFFMWGYVKNIVLKKFVTWTTYDRITAAVATIMLGILNRTWTETEYCLDVCRVTNVATSRPIKV